MKRKRFQGGLNILSFNRHFYITGLIVLFILISGLLFFELSIIWVWIILAGFLYGLIIPLIISAYVYDFSDYYDLNWLKSMSIDRTKPIQILNINAGFDETSFILKQHFPQADLKVFDFYDPERHTEPAIVRARKVSLTYPGTLTINSRKIPLGENTVDIIFLLSAAHEIRSFDEKVMFFKECKRVCKMSGNIIMVEHLRDIPNFFAFSIGFTHFFSKKVWLKVFREAGFTSVEEKKFTPFMSIFNGQL